MNETDDYLPAVLRDGWNEPVPIIPKTNDPVLGSLIKTAYNGSPDESTTFLVLADRLQELGDPREHLVRGSVRLWDMARAGATGSGTRERVDDLIARAVQEEPRRRLLVLWTCAVYRLLPAQVVENSSHFLSPVQRQTRFEAMDLMSNYARQAVPIGGRSRFSSREHQTEALEALDSVSFGGSVRSFVRVVSADRIGGQIPAFSWFCSDALRVVCDSPV